VRGKGTLAYKPKGLPMRPERMGPAGGRAEGRRVAARGRRIESFRDAQVAQAIAQAQEKEDPARRR
jgi:hypothetical protein